MRTGWEPSGSFPSALARPFPAGLAVFLLTVPRPFGIEFILPRAFLLLQRTRSTACPLSSPCFGLSTSTRTGSERLPWVFSPSSRRQSAAALTWVPVPHVRVFPESPRLGPALSGFPPSAFLTPSTVCSAADLASLFHLAAAYRVSPSGVCPSTWVHPDFSGCSPPAVRSSILRFDPRQLADLRLQGFAPHFECGDQRDW
jgi:hypothetical protein